MAAPAAEPRVTTLSDVLSADTPVAHTALVLLNIPLCQPAIQLLWRACSLRLCADGASSRLYDMQFDGACEGATAAGSRLIPDVITGDMDSARPEVVAYFKGQGASVVVNPDQDCHDLDKCLDYVRRQQEASGTKYRVFVYGGFGGRADHVMSNLAVLYRWSAFEQLVLMSAESAVELLPTGSTTVRVASDVEGPHCGLIPLGKPVEHVTSTGLRWNLSGQALAMDGLVSSSNLLDQPPSAARPSTVTVTTSEPLLWSMELQLGATGPATAAGAGALAAAAATAAPQLDTSAAARELEARVRALEDVWAGAGVASNCDDAKSAAHLTVERGVIAMGIRGARVHRVRDGYYERSLLERSAELRCGAEHLCKTLLLENKSCSGDGGRTALDSRFVCVVVQYVSKFSSDDLATGLASMGQAAGLDVTKGSFAFQMADQETAHRLSGFEFNALTPFGMATEVPLVISKQVAELSPPFAWLGGGEVLLKLRVPVAELLRTGATVVECTKPRIRDGDEWV